MRIIFTIIIISVAFISNSFGQEVEPTSEPQTISAGAEYSIYLQKLINSGQAADLKFNGIIPSPNTSPNGINAITTIEGINFDENAANGQYYNIPPDPSGAVGPSHLVSVVNTSIEWFTKAGFTQNSQRLGRNSTTAVGSFFASLTPLTGTFDPKVIYDQYNDRFVVVSLEQTTSPNTSRILIAVSKTSDPNGGWWFTSINSAVTITNPCWADYPGLAVTDDAILITNNMFSFSAGAFQGSRLWIIQKSSFYGGGVASFVRYDPSTLAGLSSQNFTMQPAHMFGTLPSGIKCYLVASGWNVGGVGIDGFSVITIGGTSTSPTFSNTFVTHLSDIHNTGVAFPEAPQPTTTNKINTPGNRVMNAVWRNNNLWAVNTINPPSGVDAGQATAHWYRMNTPLTGSVTDQGNIGGEDIATGTHTYYPSVAVNSNGDAIIGFAASAASTIFPGAYYAGRFSSTTPGTVLASQIFKPGLDYYVRIFAFNGGTRNRWGDYSGSSVDPSDGLTFYLFNEYALTRGTVFPIGTDPAQEDGRWGTAFGIVPPAALPVELSSFSASIIGSSVNLNWGTETEVNNYGFDVERSVISNVERNLSWEKIGFVDGNRNSNSPKYYSFQDKDAVSGKYSYRLKQIDNDGQFEYSKAIEVDLGLPKKFELSQNYPNPFNPSTTIRYSLPKAGNVRLTLFNILGQEIKKLVNEVKESGVHTVNFNASELNSGLYIYKIEANGFTQTRKMILIK